MLQGQWIGRYTGTNAGEAILELDTIGGNCEGRVYVYDDRVDLISAAAFISIPAGVSSHKITDLPLMALDPQGGLAEWNNIKERFPGVTFPSKANTDWTIGTTTMTVSWVTDIGTSGTGTLDRIDGSRPSTLVPLKVDSWDDFRRCVRGLEPYRYVFRGQENNSWRLRTAFHRTQRSDLVRFMEMDVAALHQHLSSLTAHTFNLLSPYEYAAFLALTQHHGYPTPLLDWTYSPYIGAYFAFKRAGAPTEKVRIFVFDRQQWMKDWRQLQRIMPARLHFTIVDALAINNSRLIPQQALSTVTNAEDIEGYISTKEKEDRKYLQAIDLPVTQREEVLRELNLMGINAGSLFPGLDGACSQLKDRFFGV
jgi:hypothetical protein